MKKILLLSLSLSLSLTLSVFAQDFNNVKFIKNYDGDTYNFDLGCGVPDLFRTMPLRLYGIDTPEIKTKNPYEKSKAIVARDFARNELLQAKQINLVNCSEDKYFRILCRVEYDNKDLTQELLNRSMGYPYFGDTKKVIDYSK